MRHELQYCVFEYSEVVLVYGVKQVCWDGEGSCSKFYPKYNFSIKTIRFFGGICAKFKCLNKVNEYNVTEF